MKIVINGCFDCFHDGHKELIDFAFSLFLETDFCFNRDLVILLNSDKSYKNLRGTFPKDSFRKRKEKIRRHLRKIKKTEEWKFFSDWPIVEIKSFDIEEELKQLIDDFKPTFILKGSDYSDLTKVVGFPDWPILIKPRGKDKDGNDISSSKIKENDRNL